MINTIRKSFEQYAKNYKDWSEAEHGLVKTVSMEEWIEDFHKTLNHFQRMYDENKSTVALMENIFSKPLTDELADTLYELTMNMYLTNINDPEFLITYYQKLLEFYKEKNDYDKIVMLYTAIQNYYLEVENPEVNSQNYDYEYLKEGMKYIKYYKELSPIARYRIWILYYNFIIRLLDYGVVSLKEALDKFDEIMSFSEEEDIRLLDKDCENILALKEYIKETLFIGIIQIDTADSHTRERFYYHTKSYFREYKQEVKSLYALPSEQYACYLYNLFFEKKITPTEVFEKYLEYFTYKFKTIKSKTTCDLDEIIQCINAISYLTKLGKLITDMELINKSMDFLVDFVQARWLKGNVALIDNINEMLSKACLSLLSYDVVGIDKEKCITQLIVQRDVHVYIRSLLTAEIALAIYHEMASQNMDFFSGIKSVPASEWKDYLYYGCLFHDIGEEKIIGNLKTIYRPEMTEETKRLEKHVYYGSKIFRESTSISKYADLISGHHAYYNGENGYPENFDRSQTDVTPFIDILSIAVFIEENSNPYWDFERKNTSFAGVMHRLELEYNKRFNGEIIDLIKNSMPLCKEIETIVTSKRDQVIYDVYHNWEKIQLSQDEKSLLDEVVEQIQLHLNTNDFKGLEPYLTRLHALSTNSKSDDIRGCALFNLMRYYFMTGDFAKAFSLESETNHLLLHTKNYEYLIKNQLNCGNAEIIRDNLEYSLMHYLSAIEIARKTPECEVEKNIALASLANIYLKSLHYERALEYFQQTDFSGFDVMNKLSNMCMEGYCYVKLNDLDMVQETKNSILTQLKENPELEIFPVHVYLAIFSKALSQKEDLDKYMALLRNERLSEDNFSYSIDEMLFYMDLLESLELYNNLADELDYYIALCEGNSTRIKIYIKLLQKRSRVVSLIMNSKEHLAIVAKLRDAMGATALDQANQLLSIEKTFWEGVELKSEFDEYKSSKEILEESVKKAQSDSEHKSQFLSSMSHEIRTPINAILGLNEMILRESNEDNTLQYAADIHNAGKQLLGIINDVLDYSKIEAGKMEIVSSKYNLGEMVNDIKNMIEPKLAEKNLNFILRCNPSIPNVLYGDDLRIKQVLLNLLSNAYKYTQHGFVQFIIDYEKKDEESIILKFAVKDTGIGLKPEQIEKLAIPFERFDHVKNRGVEGTGLGMSIVNKLLEQMDSKLEIESVYEMGSTFSFNIVQGVIEWGNMGKLDEVRKKVINNTIEKKLRTNALYAPKAKVLVVDDNAVNLKVMQALLKRTGMQVTTAMSGTECLELCKENFYNIILLDHMMPEMDGIETLNHLKEMGGINKDTPIIALTANVVESADDYYKKAGFDDLLTKPMNVDRMEEMLFYYLPEYLLESK